MIEDKTTTKKLCVGITIAIVVPSILWMSLFFSTGKIIPVQLVVLVAVTAISGGALYCFCASTKGGFGPYNTSTLVIILVLTLAGILAIGGYLDKQTISNIFMAVIGFIAGIFSTATEVKKTNTSTNS